MSLSLNQFNYPLPEHLIATTPAKPRDHSRLMVLNRTTKEISNRRFYDLPTLIPKNAVVVVNQTKVFPARLYGQKTTGGKVEILLLNQLGSHTWQGISKPGLKPGQAITLSGANGLSPLTATVIDKDQEGLTTLTFNLGGVDFFTAIDAIGHTPLPPYISSNTSETTLRHQYQTVYAKDTGSAAAPTAGLHFTPNLLATLKKQGVHIEYITLHVGLGTFKNPNAEQIANNTLHKEWFEITPQTAKALNKAKRAGRPIIAVGTTSVRTLESATDNNGEIIPQTGTTSIFIQPGYTFKFVDHLITNFHLPETSLLMLIAAFTTAPQTEDVFTDFQSSFIGKAYLTAIKENYRFFSFGDAMLIL